MRSVSEVALELGVSRERVRQLIASGSLPAVRVGGRWVMNGGEAKRLPEGRPWGEGAAWGMLWLVLGRPAPWLSVKQRQRVRVRVGEGVRGHFERLSSRAVARSFGGHPSVVARLVEDVRVVVAGVSAAAGVGADLVVSGRVDGYVRAGDVAALVAEYGLESVPIGEGNVVLRVVSEVWPFDERERVAPRLVVALDLLDDADGRTKRAGDSLLDLALGEVSG